jgi:type I restriction enzyme S subunit
MGRRAIGMADINAKELKSLPVIIPDIRLQQCFARRVSDIEKYTHILTAANRAVLGLFQILMERGLSGELTARWREAHADQLIHEAEEQAKALGIERADTSSGLPLGSVKRVASC